MLSKEDRKLIARALGGHAVRNLKAWGTVTLDEDRLAALLAAARAEAAPVVSAPSSPGDGWVMVPREPTEAMLAAGHQQIDWCRNGQRTLTNDDPSQTPGGT